MLKGLKEMGVLVINGGRYILVMEMYLDDLDGPHGPRYLGLIQEAKFTALVELATSGKAPTKEQLGVMWVREDRSFAVPVSEDRLRLLNARLDYLLLNVKLEANRGA